MAIQAKMSRENRSWYCEKMQHNSLWLGIFSGPTRKRINSPFRVIFKNNNNGGVMRLFTLFSK